MHSIKDEKPLRPIVSAEMEAGADVEAKQHARRGPTEVSSFSPASSGQGGGAVASVDDPTSLPPGARQGEQAQNSHAGPLHCPQERTVPWPPLIILGLGVGEHQLCN